MDVGNKTLSQLSDEAKEKRYVTLDVGAKVSGYTKEYLERLCRLNKVEYRVWNNGQFVIELESLLRETHTILLSYEDIMFVDKAELADSTAQIVSEVLLSTAPQATQKESALAASQEASKIFSTKVIEGITQSVPNFGGTNRIVSRSDNSPAFSFVGRAVVSDPLHPEVPTQNNTHISITDLSKKSEQSTISKVTITPPSTAQQIIPHASTHILINGNANVPEMDANVTPPIPTNKGPVHLHLNVIRDKGVPISAPQMNAGNEQITPNPLDSLLTNPTSLSVATNTSVATIQTTASQVNALLHPIRTSVDASAHYDDAPLFPFDQKNTPLPTIPTQPAVPHYSGIPDLGPNKRVVVFSPEVAKPSLKLDQNPNEQSIIPTPSNSPTTIPESTNSHVALLFPPNPTQIAPATVRSISQTPSHALERSTERIPVEAKVILPTTMNEQHLVLREKFPLAKSTAFNIAFALCLVISLFAFRGELEHTLFGNPITYVAAVAGATPEGESIKNISNTSKKESTSETTTLPFSDDVQIATGTDMNSVTITPVFPNAQGDAVQYVIMNGQEYEPTNTGE